MKGRKREMKKKGKEWKIIKGERKCKGRRTGRWESGNERGKKRKIIKSKITATIDIERK